MIPKSYTEVRRQIRDGDTLFYRTDRSLFNRVIRRGTGSELVHVGKAAWWGDPDNDGRLYLLDTVIHKGGRAVLFSSQVEWAPGHWDWYTVNRQRYPHYDAKGAVAWMQELTGHPYGLGAVVSIAVRHTPMLSWFFRPDTDDTHVDERPPFCSMAAAMADRIGGGVDPVPNLADAFVSPAALAESPLWLYQCTLVP